MSQLMHVPRASTVGGWVDLSSNASGTTLILSVPLDAAHAVAGHHEEGQAHRPPEPSDPPDSESEAWTTR